MAAALPSSSTSDSAAFMKDVQRVCAAELARCMRKLEAQTSKSLVAWKLDVEQAISRLSDEIATIRYETHEIVERANESRERAYEDVRERLCTLETDVAAVQQRLQREPDRLTTDKIVAERPIEHCDTGQPQNDNAVDDVTNARNRANLDPDSQVAAPTDSCVHNDNVTRQTLVSGSKLSVTGFSALNAAAYALQYCRFYRGEQGIIDTATGELSPYTQLVEDVQRVSEALRLRGLQSGSIVRVCSSTASWQLLVLALAVWNLLGTIEIDSAPDCSAEDVGSADAAELRHARTDHWLVCDSMQRALQYVAQVGWTPEQIINVGSDMDSRSSDGCIAFADLLDGHAVCAISYSQVPSDAVAMRVHSHIDGVTSFTHLEVIESVERSLHALASDLCPTNSRADSDVVVNALPFNHAGCLCVAMLPALVLGVSVLPLSLVVAIHPSSSSDELAKHFAAHKVTSIVIAPEALVALSECRTLRDLEATVLQRVVCVGAPIPTLPRSLKCLASWRDALTCRRVLTTDAFLGAVFTTDDLLAPIRQRTAPRCQELGAPLANVYANVTKSGAMSDDADVFELTIEMAGLRCLRNERLASVMTGVFVTVSWASERSDAPLLSVLATTHRSYTRPFATLPIEELIASHPLVADAAILHRSRVCESSPSQLLAAKTEQSSEFDVVVRLTPGARKYAVDSVATIQNFVAKKLSASDALVLRSFVVVDCVHRDAHGRAVTELLEQRVADNRVT